MDITDVADDTAPRFLWPMQIRNERGINLQDVFNIISANFREHIYQNELDSWDERRRYQSWAGYWGRVRRNQIVDFHSNNAGLKRVDYMGDRVMFRGLEPSPRMDGTWMLCLGPF
jgi:hypothetical protein